MAMRRSFSSALRTRVERTTQAGLLHAQRYAIRERQRMHGEVGSEEHRERMERLGANP